MIEEIAQRILSLHGWVALAIVFALPALEASAFVGFLFPGEIAVILGGVLASEGRISLGSTIAAAVLGAIVGDAVGYFVGRHYGRAMLQKTVGRLMDLERVRKAEEYLCRRGGAAVFLGRFTAALRVLIPGLSGMCRMPYSTFSFYNVAGGTVWGVLFVLVGYFAAASWRQIHRIAGMTSLALVAAAVLIFVALRVSRAHREELELPHMAKTVAERRHWSLFGLLGLLCGVIFLSLALHAMRHPDGGPLDDQFMRLVLSYRIGWISEAMKVVSGLGSSLVLLPLIILAGHDFLVRRGDWRPALALLTSWLGSVLLYTSLKNLVERPRPPEAYLLVHASGSSFPSGHATQVIAVLGAMACIFSRGRAPQSRVALAAICAFVCLLVGAARIYLGAHWLTDVLAGYVLGGIWLFGVMMWFPDRAAGQIDRAKSAG